MFWKAEKASEEGGGVLSTCELDDAADSGMVDGQWKWKE